MNGNSNRRWSGRAFTSVLTMASFALIVVTGILLFFTPPGRIANWTDWTILGLTKAQWIALHLWFGIVFLLAALLHLVLNWQPMMAYFRNRSSRRFGFRWEWAAALALVAVVAFGAGAGWRPFSPLTDWRNRIKQGFNEPDRSEETSGERGGLDAGKGGRGPAWGRGEGRGQGRGASREPAEAGNE